MIEIKVFISCPSRDTILENLLSELLSKADDLNKYYEPQGFRVKPLYWEQPFFVGSEKGKTPQQLIDEKVGDYDLYFGIMGSRYGGEQQDNYISPTEYEFNDALARNANSNQHKYPRIVCFSFLEVNEEDCDEGQFEKIMEFRNRAWKTGISKVYQNNNEIVRLFESKLKECIDTAYIKYLLPNEYIIPLSVTDRTNAKGSIFKLNQSKPNDVIGEGKRILLLGSGGSGKSTYLKYLAYYYSNESDLFTPVYIKLKLYTAESIEELVILETRSLPKKPLLLLDGYDELSDDTKLQFHKQLLKYEDRHLDVPIVVTSRPIDPSTTPLKDFHLYEMSILGYDQIKQYITLNHIDENVFTNSPILSELYSLLQIPFYLGKIVEFYKMEGSLPTSMSQILEFAFEQGTISDKEHFDTSFNANYEYDEMYDFLSLLSFCMTNSGKTSLLRKELESIIPDSKIVDFLQKYTRLIESERNQQGLVYSFSHKIFQDYLAAKAICQISYSSTMDIISDSNKKSICYYWEPSIPFLIELLPGNEKEAIVKYIFSKHPSLLIEVKPDFLCDDMKQRLFTSTFEHYAATTQYIPSSVDRRKLASIWDSSSMEKYLLGFIGDTLNQNYMLIEAFILLSYSQKVNKGMIDKALIECMQNEQLAGYRKSLNNIATLFIRINVFDQSVLDELYVQNPRDTIQLLAVYDKSFSYIDVLIDLYKEIDRKPKQDQDDSETKQSIEDYLVYCIKSNHIQEVVAEIIISNLLRDTYCLRDEMKEIVQSACENYKFDDIYEDMYRLFVNCIDTDSYGHISELSAYFIIHNADYKVVKRVFDEGKDNYNGVMLVLLNPDSDTFVKSICEDLIPNLDSPRKEQILKHIANSQFPPLYNEILEQQGISIEQYKVESNKERKKKRLIKDMDLVLNVDLLISELDDIFGNDDFITIEYFRSFGRYEISTVIERLFRDYLNNNRGRSIIPKELIKKSIQKNHQALVLDFVTSNFKKHPCIDDISDNVDIDLSPELKKWLCNWKDEVLLSSDVTKSYKQIDSVSVEIDTRVEYLWTLIKEDLVEVNDAVLLDFMSFVLDISEDWSVIEAKISNKQKIRTRIVENLKNMHILALMPLANHIWFCTNNDYYEVLPHSYDILRRLEDDYWKDGHLRCCCLECIIRIEKDQTRFSEYVVDCPNDILGDFARGYVKERRSMRGLIERLKTEVKLGESESTHFYLYYLVCMGDIESLAQYIDKIKRTQDFYIDYEYPNPFELITDETQLGLLLDLLSFSLMNEIRQSQYHNLTRCILSSAKNIAYLSQENYERTLGLLTDLTNQYPNHQDTYLLFEYLWKIEEEMTIRTTILPSLSDSHRLYYTLKGSQDN